MDDTLKAALEQYLSQITDPVAGLLAVEVDWGAHTPPITDEIAAITFQGATWQIVLTDSELVLRRTLCRAHDERVIWLLAQSSRTRIPSDIRARLHGKTVHRLGLRARLYAMTGRDWPPEVDHAEWRSTIERRLDYLVRHAGQPGTLNWAVSHNDLEVLLLRAAFGIELTGKSAPQVLADLVASQPVGAPLPDGLELAILESHLRANLPEAADVLAWAAAEPGRAENLVRIGLMMAAEKEVRLAPNWGSLNTLRARMVSARRWSEAEAMADVMALAVAALSHLPKAQMNAIVEAAERDLAGVLPPDSYVRWFPMTLVSEIDRLAKHLAEGHLPAPGRVAELRGHLFAGDYAERLNALEKMIALVDGRRQQTIVVAGLKVAPGTKVSAWADWYGQHGSRLDLTALELTREVGQSAELKAAAAQVLKDHWAWRSSLNRLFAERYLAGYEAALHDRDGAFGTHHILRWAVRPLLDAGRHVLLVVVDGMSYPDFWYLIGQWAKTKKPVFPAQLRHSLALLPSVTSISRRAIFLDKLPTDRLDDEETYEQKARMGEIEALAQSLRGQAVRLYNKSNLDPEQLVADLQARTLNCIGLIVNGIDEDLKSSATTIRLPDLRDLEPLDRAVQTALDADWAVLITADHGHTWHLDKKLRRGPQTPGGGERFAPLAPGGIVPEDAVSTADPNIVRVQDGQSVALLTACGAYFGQNPRRGYHGGASLEEVVVPCVLLVRQPATGLAPAARPQAPAAEPEMPGLAGVVLTLRNGSTVSLKLPFSLEPFEARLLQALAYLGEASEDDLRRTLGTRRIAGPLAALRESLAAHGLEYVEDKGSGPGGAIYRFRDELLPR